MGVDTSLRGTGLGVVEARGNAYAVRCFSTVKVPFSWPHTKCLQHIYTRVRELIARENPDAAAVEGIFYCKNVRTAMTLGQARGVVLAACASASVPVFEYAPRTIKQSVVGFGSAHKDQVVHMVSRMLGLAEPPSNDEADALALAICHLQAGTHPALSPKEI